MKAIDIHPLATEEEARRCASMMCSTEPWITIGRNFDESLTLVQDPTREVYVAYVDGEVQGFVILNMNGAFVGYIQAVCVDSDARGNGLGTRLVRFAEQRIFSESPNVFLCVSSFNPRARELYERLGYEFIGELKDYLVRGHSELLMRKTIGPIRRAT
jgi:ribosomal protein S18 acetylase RimI-like enzyme